MTGHVSRILSIMPLPDESRPGSARHDHLMLYFLPPSLLTFFTKIRLISLCLTVSTLVSVQGPWQISLIGILKPFDWKFCRIKTTQVPPEVPLGDV